jgi:hypothetical protein
MTASSALPAEGPAQVGSVACRWADGTTPIMTAPQLVAWVTTEPLAEAGSAWLALSTEHTVTGLVPVVLSGDTTDVSEAYGVPATADGLPYFGFHYPAEGASQGWPPLGACHCPRLSCSKRWPRCHRATPAQTPAL